MSNREKINIADKLSLIDELFTPKTLAQINDHDIKIAKMDGPFPWHSHSETDEFFLVIKGRLAIKYHDKDIILEAGEMTVVPKGVEHATEALEPSEIVMIELAGTSKSGD